MVRAVSLQGVSAGLQRGTSTRAESAPMPAEVRHRPARAGRRLWRFVTVIEQERGANDHEWLHREAFQLKPLLEAALLAAPAVPLKAYWMKDGKMSPTTVEDWLAKTESFHVQSSFAAWVICEARRLIDALTKGAAPAVPQDEQDRAELARIPESYETPG